MARFMDEAGAKALEQAIAKIEEASAAEVVIAVRPHAHLWHVPAIALGLVTAAASLAYALFGEPEFDLWMILSLPAVVGATFALLVQLPPIYRLLLPARIRDAHVAQAGRAAFLEQNVHATRGRTGVLVYISLLERRLLLVGDLAIERTLGDALLDRWERELSALIGKGAPAVAKALAEHAAELGKLLPHQADDTNELPDAIRTLPPRGRRSAR